MHSAKQMRMRSAYGQALRAGGVLLRPPGKGNLVRNQESGRVLPCCWSDCMADGDDRIRVEVPHDTPRWSDPTTGKQEMLVYIFCSEAHKEQWLTGLAQG